MSKRFEDGLVKWYSKYDVIIHGPIDNSSTFILIVELINAYVEINIFSEIYDSPTIVTEHPCDTGMKTMLTSFF